MDNQTFFGFVDDIDAQTKAANKASMAEYSKRMDAFYKKIFTAILKDDPTQKNRVAYSAYKNDETDNPIDNLDEVAFEGKCVLFQDHDNFFGSGRSYISEELENPTWLQVSVEANKMIEVTGDDHHIYLESIYKVSSEYSSDAPEVEDDVTILKFSMGS
jgi:hypothetical protein